MRVVASLLCLCCKTYTFFSIIIAEKQRFEGLYRFGVEQLTFDDHEWSPDRTVVSFLLKGKLGITWQTQKSAKGAKAVCIKSIKPDSLAASYPTLKPGMIVRKVAKRRDGDCETNVAGWAG